MKRYYIGIGNTFHDSSIAIIDENAEVLFAEATERRLQFKRAMNCPPDNFGIDELIRKYCGDATEIIIAGSWSEQFYNDLRKMDLQGKFSVASLSDPLLRTDLSYLFPASSVMATSALQYNYLKNSGIGLVIAVEQALGHSNVSYKGFPHHLCHASYSCYSSPFDEAGCLIVDGHGEGGSFAMYDYKEGKISELMVHKGNESLGMLYELITTYCGFNWFKGEEWKVMGLAPYGEQNNELQSLVNELCRVEDGKLKYATHEKIVSTLTRLNQYKRPKNSNPFDAADLALAGQNLFCNLMSELITYLYGISKKKNLTIGGGCGLNSSFNGRVSELTPFEQSYIPSAPADDGNAIGAAWLAWQEDHPNHHPCFSNYLSPYLGSLVDDHVVHRLQQFGKVKSIRKLSFGLYNEVAGMLAEGKLIGWIQGRAEFGPRALGNRSILADPRPAGMKDMINLKVKFREEFRPFAPSVLHEYGNDYFENYTESPYMERTLRWRDGVVEKVPAVVHANQTGRLQTVKKEYNSRYYKLIKSFYDKTGVPLLLNTSLNVMGKPIVHSAEDAITLFYTTGLDVLVINDYVIEK